MDTSIFTESKITQLLDVIPSFILILDENQKVIHTNRAFQEYVGILDPEWYMHKRPGQILNCRYVNSEKVHCGDVRECQVCGAHKAVVDSLSGVFNNYDFNIIDPVIGERRDFRVHAAPFPVMDTELTVMTLTDISGEFRRKAMERIFFHDILNLAGLIYGLLDCALDDLSSDPDPIMQRVVELNEKLIDEIKMQRELLRAENNELIIKRNQIRLEQFLLELKNMFSKQSLTGSRMISIKVEDDCCKISSDPTIVRRIMINMLKNAIEASPDGAEITLGAERLGEHWVRLWVHNPVFISPKIQAKIFHRAFSTKETGRGMGTYSMKLLGEKYLHGRVDFTSTKEEGTTFFIDLEQ